MSKKLTYKKIKESFELDEVLALEELTYVLNDYVTFRPYLINLVENKVEKVESSLGKFSGSLLSAFALMSFMNESFIFSILSSLCHKKVSDLEQFLGEYFISDQLPFFLAYSVMDLADLKSLFMSDSVDIQIKKACLQAMTFFVSFRIEKRASLMQFFKEFLQKSLEDSNYDVNLNAYVAHACCDLYPKEVAEEIKDLFGFGMINRNIIEIMDLEVALEEGFLESVNMLKEEFVDCDPISVLYESMGYEEGDDDLEKHEEEILKVLINLDKKNLINIPKTQGNDSCFCGSGIKYKICCEPSLQEKATKNIEAFFSVHLDDIKISEEVLPECDLYEQLSQKDFSHIMGVVEKYLSKDPQKVIKMLLPYKDKFPNVPEIYQQLYYAYSLNDEMALSGKIIEEAYKKFPKNLFARVEKALYYLRKGDQKKIPALFDNTFVLKKLYPKKTSFNLGEITLFHTFMVEYLSAIGDFYKAKLHIKLLSELISDNDEIIEIVSEILKKAMYEKAVSIYFNKNKHDFEQKFA